MSPSVGTAVGLVVAKAPVPGEAKTRLATAVGERAAADLAAAALLDTFTMFEETFGVGRCAVAWTGDLRDAAAATRIAAHLDRWTVFEQRGPDFAHRLLHAHQDTHERLGGPVVQVGMDTPQMTPELLASVVDPMARGLADAVLAPAYDGGWWALGVSEPRWLSGLETVTMSITRTADLTRDQLTANGARVTMGPTLRDVDTAEDADLVGAAAPGTRFARLWREQLWGGPLGGGPRELGGDLR